MKHFVLLLSAATFLTACAQTSVQRMSKSTFQVASTTAPICGRSGAAKMTSKVAAIEVIKAGGDRFVISSADAGSEFSGGIMPRAQQGIIVKMVDGDDPEFADSLSARELLGDKWEKQVRKGKPSTC